MTARLPTGTAVLRVAQFVERTAVLGPGTRTGLWVQGCPLRCRGCISPQFLPAEGGREVTVAALADDILAVEGTDGITFSGGEPFAQAGPLADLLDEVRRHRDLSAMSYTGWRLEHLIEHGDADQRRLLERLDLLVDGPYLPERHAAVRWRGSDNQRVHLLTDRHPQLLDEPDESAGIEAGVAHDGSIAVIGVPPVPDFVDRFLAGLDAAGVHVEPPRPSHAGAGVRHNRSVPALRFSNPARSVPDQEHRS